MIKYQKVFEICLKGKMMWELEMNQYGGLFITPNGYSMKSTRSISYSQFVSWYPNLEICKYDFPEQVPKYAKKSINSWCKNNYKSEKKRIAKLLIK